MDENLAHADVGQTESMLAGRGLGRKIASRWRWRYLDIDLQPGSRLALAGASGSGKTLLLRALAGLDDVDEGEIRFRGLALHRLSMPRYRGSAIYLHQRPALLEGTVEENLRAPLAFAVHRGRVFGGGHRGVGRPAQERISVWLDRIGMDRGLLKTRVEHLSGGEAQIVCLLRALQLDPQILLLDEITASLDAGAVAGVEALIASWQAANPIRAYIWTSHDAALLARLADRTVSLDSPGHDGGLATTGSST